MKKILSVVVVVMLTGLVSSCSSAGPHASGGQHSGCGAYGNP